MPNVINVQQTIERMNRQALYGDPPACEWRSEVDGKQCVLERHEGAVHAVFTTQADEDP